MVQLRVFTEPQQGATYDDLLAMARAAEQLGFEGFFRSDHYLHMGPVTGLPGPTDAWVTLAGLARDTTTIRLGTLVTSATFRYPGPLAVTVAQIDRMSRGRIELGLGAGWYEAEHRALGIPFPALGVRFERLREQLQLITGLWETPIGELYEFAGEHYRLTGAPGLPKPVQQPLPIIMGGRGRQRTPRLAALYAHEFNAPFFSLAEFAEQTERVRRACLAVGRDPSTMRFSAALTICCGGNSDEFQRRAASIGRQPDELRQNGAAGLPRQVAETLRAWVAAGASRIYLQLMDARDVEHLELIAAEVVPLLT